MKKYTDLSLADYLEKLSSDTPSPGGGSVLAYVGALAMGLTQMVARIAAKRKTKETLSAEDKNKEEAKRDDLKKIVDALEKIKQKSLDVVTLDAKVYDEVMACYAQKASAEKLEDALDNAFRLQADLAMIIVMAKKQNEKTKKLVSGALANDLIVSAGLLATAFEGALHTAHINVVYMKNAQKKEHAEKALEELRKEFDKKD